MPLSYSRDTISHGTTGVKTMTVGFQPVKARLVARIAPGSDSPIIFRCEGNTNGTNQNGDTFTAESTRVYQRTYTDRMISISEWNGSAWVETFKITFDSFTATEFKYNVVTANSGFQLLREVEG